MRGGEEVRLGVPLCRHRGGADAHAGGLLGASRFVGNAVFVERDAVAVELVLHRLAGEPRFREIEQKQVVVRAAGHNVVAHFPELLAHRAAVSHNGVDVFAVFVRAGFLGGDGLARDHVLERPALRAGEHGTVHLLRKLRLTEDHAAARPAQRFVRRGRDDVGETERRRVIPCRDETRDVRHIHHKVCAHAFGDVREAREIDDAAVRRSARENELRLIFGGLLLHVRKVDEALRVHVVEFHIEELAAEIDGRAVRQVAAVIERHGEDRVARLQYAHIRREIRVRAAVRLDVHMVVGMEHLFPHGAAVFL